MKFRLIGRDTDYAVRALVFMLQHKEKIISVSELVKELKIPRPFLRKILQKLSKKGFLVSYKGKGGGFKLSVSPDRIFLIDLIKLFQGPVKLNECLLNKKICPDIKTCPLRKKLLNIEKFVMTELKSITLKSLSE